MRFGPFGTLIVLQKGKVTHNLGCPRKGKLNLNLWGGVSDNVRNAVTDSKSKYLNILYLVAARKKDCLSSKKAKGFSTKIQ